MDGVFGIDVMMVVVGRVLLAVVLGVMIVDWVRSARTQALPPMDTWGTWEHMSSLIVIQRVCLPSERVSDRHGRSISSDSQIHRRNEAMALYEWCVFRQKVGRDAHFRKLTAFEVMWIGWQVICVWATMTDNEANKNKQNSVIADNSCFKLPNCLGCSIESRLFMWIDRAMIKLLCSRVNIWRLVIEINYSPDQGPRVILNTCRRGVHNNTYSLSRQNEFEFFFVGKAKLLGDKYRWQVSSFLFRQVAVQGTRSVQFENSRRRKSRWHRSVDEAVVSTKATTKLKCCWHIYVIKLPLER